MQINQNALPEETATKEQGKAVPSGASPLGCQVRLSDHELIGIAFGQSASRAFNDSESRKLGISQVWKVGLPPADLRRLLVSFAMDVHLPWFSSPRALIPSSAACSSSRFAMSVSSSASAAT